MKQITRHEAETLFITSEIISTNIEQDKKEMRIFLKTSDSNGFLVKYNFQDHTKTYFIQNSKK